MLVSGCSPGAAPAASKERERNKKTRADDDSPKGSDQVELVGVEFMGAVN